MCRTLWHQSLVSIAIVIQLTSKFVDARPLLLAVAKFVAQAPLNVGDLVRVIGELLTRLFCTEEIIHENALEFDKEIIHNEGMDGASDNYCCAYYDHCRVC